MDELNILGGGRRGREGVWEGGREGGRKKERNKVHFTHADIQ